MKVFIQRLKYLPGKSRSGVAMILAVASLTLMTYLAMEIMYETTIEYAVNAQGLHRIQAHYAAKSGLEIGLLRVKIFQQLQPMLKNLGGTTPLGDVADLVWKLPFQWPIQVPEGVDMVNQSLLEESGEESLMKAKYSVQIELEGTKIDLNDLWSPSKGLREITKKQLINIFEAKARDDQEFFRKHAGMRWEELVNNITDFMSDKRDSLNGGNKRDGYAEFASQDFPPNRAFISLEELRLVNGMTDEFFDLLAPAVTVYGMRAINPNKAPPEVIRSLHASITDQIVQELMKRRSDPDLGPAFKKTEDPNDPESFWSFLENNGARIDDETKKVPLIFDDYYNFRITSIGEAGTARSTLIAIVVDLKKQAKQVGALIKEEAAANNNQQQNPPPAGTTPPPGGTQPSGQQAGNKAEAPSKGPPRIVYWQEL